MSASVQVTQLFPEKKQLPLEGLYLSQRLPEVASRIDRPLVVTAYVTDRNGVVANRGDHNNLQVPPQIKNDNDWRLVQEILAQSDVVISSSAYLKGVKASGGKAQDILFQFEPGGKFEDLGQWRLQAGLGKRHPDLVFLTHHLDFEFPPGLLGGDRKVFVFTTFAMAESKEAGAMADAGAIVIGSGETGVEGDRLIDYLGMDSSYHVIMMATGPSVLQLLLINNCLDFMYITEVQRELSLDDPSAIRTILPEGKRVDELERFTLTHRYLQENVTTSDGARTSQEFHRYDRKDLFSG